MAFGKGNNRAAKLVGEQVLEIREKYLTGQYTIEQLCHEYHVSWNTISNVVNYRTWQNVAIVAGERRPPGFQPSTPLLSEDEMKAMIERTAAVQREVDETKKGPPPSLYGPDSLAAQGFSSLENSNGLDKLQRLANGVKTAEKKVNDDLDRLKKGD